MLVAVRALDVIYHALSVLSFGCTSMDLRVLIGLWYTGMSEDSKILANCSDSLGETYGMLSSVDFSGVYKKPGLHIRIHEIVYI